MFLSIKLVFMPLNAVNVLLMWISTFIDDFCFKYSNNNHFWLGFLMLYGVFITLNCSFFAKLDDKTHKINGYSI